MQILGCLTVQKLYGRDPGSSEAITEVFQSMLGKYPGEKVTKAMETWMERSPEFPSPADIISIIKRNGRPPLTKEMFIAISKKDPENRTKADWQYIEDYEAQERGEAWDSEHPDPEKDKRTLQENIRLRQEVKDLKAEIKRLGELLHAERVRTGAAPPKPSEAEKVRRTAEAMRKEGAKPEDIEEFLHSYGVTMEAA